MAIDYAKSGLTIQGAMLDLVRKSRSKAPGPKHIVWNGRAVATADVLLVPTDGVVRAEVLSSKGSIPQGFDIKVEGWLELVDGKRVDLLRTWCDTRYEPTVEYPFHCDDRQMWVWNVYKMEYPQKRAVEEKWTGNAGLWVEEVSDCQRIYHCSHGGANPPDFESLVFRIDIRAR